MPDRGRRRDEGECVDGHTHGDNRRLDRLFMTLHRHPGVRVEGELRALALSARTFVANNSELMRSMDAFESAFPNPLFQRGRRLDLWEYSFEVVRFFQNTIAAGESFLEHCRTTVKRRYRRHSFGAEFERQYVTCIKGSAVCMFVKELRGVVLHKMSPTPAVSRRLSGFSDRYEAMCAIQLSTGGIEADRSRWLKKNPKAVEYLDTLRGAINIRRVICEYHGALKVFADWLLKRLREINIDALAESDALHREIAGQINGIVAEEIEVLRRGATRESWF